MSRPDRTFRRGAALLLLAGLGLLGLSLGSRRDAPAASAARAATPAAASETVAAPQRSADPAVETSELSLGRRGTLASALERLGAFDAERAGILEALAGRLDPQRLRPDTAVVAQRDASGRLRRLSIRPDTAWFLRVELGETGGVQSVERIELPVVVEVATVHGVIERSVAEALAHVPHGTQLTADYADVFQWDVDLLVDPRPGDRIRIVHEVRRLGEVPADLPSFGHAASRSGELLGAGRILAASYEGARVRADAFWVDDGRGGAYFDRSARPLRKSFLKSPLNYRRISSGFSRARRNPVTRRVVPHHGVDYAARAGTPVVAAADGRVVFVGWDGALGRAVHLRHGSEYRTIYGHLSGVARGVRPGVDVQQNRVIGYVGSTGRATGPHLHYTVLHRGRPIDPLRMENPPVEPLDPALRPALALAIELWAPALDLAGHDGSARAWASGICTTPEPFPWSGAATCRDPDGAAW